MQLTSPGSWNSHRWPLYRIGELRMPLLVFRSGPTHESVDLDVRQHGSFGFLDTSPFFPTARPLNARASNT
jgi:hypothetical protein